MNKKLLNSLVGRVVNVYKGGSEANTGILLGASDDFLVLQTEDGEVIYYTLEHVKSISEDSQVRFQTMLNNLENELTDEFVSDTNELLHSLKNELVRIDRGGPESRIGTLLDVKNDYFTLYTEKDGLIFYRKKHIKSISKGMTDTNQANEAKSENKRELDVKKLLAVYKHVSADTFLELLQNIQYSWIKINRGGPESVQGVLVDSNEDFLLLSVKEDVLRVPIFHIKNISVRVKNKQNEEKQNNEEQNKQDEQQNDSEQNSSEQNKQDQNEDNNEQKNNDKNDKKNDKQDKKQKGGQNEATPEIVSIQYVNKRNNQNHRVTKFSNVDTRRL